MSDEAAFLAALRANPADDTTRLVYADWLEEQGEPEQAEYLRLVCTLVGVPDNELSESPFADRLRFLSERVLPWWQADVGARFELALLEFNPTDRVSIELALERLLEPVGRAEIGALVAATPVAIRSRMSLPAAVELHMEWPRYCNWFHSKPRVVIRPIPYPLYSDSGLFDLLLRELPRDFWPRWAATYKSPISALHNLPPREAADRVRRLPAVLFRAVKHDTLATTLTRTRRAFNQPYCDLLPPDALTVVPHAPAANKPIT